MRFALYIYYNLQFDYMNLLVVYAAVSPQVWGPTVYITAYSVLGSGFLPISLTITDYWSHTGYILSYT